MKKGRTNNPAGRPKGTPNKVTNEMKSWIQQLIDGNRQQLERDLKGLDPADRWRIVEKLMAYVLPKMQSVEAKVELGQMTDEQLDVVITELTKSINNERE